MFDRQKQLEMARLLDSKAVAAGAVRKSLPVVILPRDKDGQTLNVGDKIAYLGYVNGTPRLMTGVILSTTATSIVVNTRRSPITKFHNVVKL